MTDSRYDYYIEDHKIQVPCNAPAPLVLNGASYIGCKLLKDHEGPHKVEIVWR